MSDREEWRKAIANDFLESSAAAFAAPYLAARMNETPSSDSAGTVIGRYRLVRELGRGGMGWVWLAERADGQFEQQVALKLIKRGMDSDEILARFLRERQILARLEDPNIARLLDGGVSDDGRPYFAMEYVPGTPITTSCDARRLGIDARLRLFVVVCRAVQYAHRNLVVHRDIKPSNVLVTDSSDVKLLDFGVAKLLDDGDATQVTGTGRPNNPLTPAYASPEQLAGEPVTTTSDIYQLGVLLHELLAGARPGQPITNPADVAERRGTTPERLQRRLRGDIDAIIQRALRAEPDRRFPSAEAMADDIERHLAHLPIRHGDNARRYRWAKFVRRNRVRLAAGALVATAVMTMGTVYVVKIRRERDRAQREAAKASESAALLYRFFRGWNVDAADRGQVSAGKLLHDAALGVERDLHDQPETFAATISMLGDLHTALGLTVAADSLLGQALAIQERLGEPASVDLATTLYRRGKLLNLTGQYRDGELVLRRAVATYRRLWPLERTTGLHAQLELALTLYPQGKLAEAEAILRDAAGNAGDNAPFRTELLAELGYVLFLEARYQEASALLRPVLAEQRRVFGPLSRPVLHTARALASSLRDRASLPEAESLVRNALTISQALFGEAHLETHFSHASLAVLLERKGDFADAERVARLAVESSLRIFGINNLNSALMLRTHGGALLAQGNAVAAESELRRSLASFQQAFAQGYADEADVLNRLAYILVKRGAADADTIYRQAVAFERARPATDPVFVTDGYEYLGWAARRMGEPALADTLLRRAVALYDGELPDGHVYRVQAKRWLAGVE